MRYPLSEQQIEQVCRDLLASSRRVTVRGVMARLRTVFGASGRTERVAAILSRLASECPLPISTPAASEQVPALRERLRAVEERAARAEMREREHQDLWADRFSEKVRELEHLHAARLRVVTEAAANRYLRLYQRAADLANRLSRYEKVEAFGSEIESGLGGKAD